jgi:hypothetical protein
VDEELLGLLKEKRPYWTPVMGFSDRSPICENDPFNDQVLPAATVATIREACARPANNAAAREETLLSRPRCQHAGKHPQPAPDRERVPARVEAGS